MSKFLKLKFPNNIEEIINFDDIKYVTLRKTGTQQELLIKFGHTGEKLFFNEVAEELLNLLYPNMEYVEYEVSYEDR